MEFVNKSLVDLNHGLSSVQPRARFTRALGENTGSKYALAARNAHEALEINDKFRVINSFVQQESNFHRDNMVRRTCKHCPIPGCGSKFLVRLADHLTRVRDLSELERKYWLQFSKLQNTNYAIRVHHKEVEPKTIFL